MKIIHRIEVKLFLLILFIAAVFTSIFLVLQEKEREEMKYLTKDAEKNLQQLTEKVVNLNGKSFETHVFDFSFWDEMVDFVRTQSPKWAEDNIIAGLKTYGTTSMWVYDKKFNLKYAYSENNQKDLVDLHLSDIELDKMFKQNWFPHYFKKTDRGVLEIRGAPIQPSSDNARITEPLGYLFGAKLWDSDYVNELSILTLAEVSLVEPIIHDKLEQIKSEEEQFIVKSRKILSDHLGNNIAVLRIEKKSELISILQYSTYRKFIVLLINAILLLIVISFVLFFQVIKPINTLSKSLNFSDPSVLDPMGKTKGEFGSLAKLMQEFFKQREQLENEVVVRKKAQADLQNLNDELEKRVEDRTNEIQRQRDQAKRYLDIAGSIISVLDKDGNIKLMNKKGYEILGYENDELIGKNWFETCLPSQDRGELFAYFTKLMKNESEIPKGNINEVETKHGLKKVLMFQNTLMSDENNNYSGIIFSAQDITELIQKEKELMAAKEKAEESSRLKSAFLANMSHELRTPMIGILGYSELLLDESMDSSTKEMIQTVHDSATRLLDTLNLILDLSRLEANKQEINLQKRNINDLLRAIHSGFAGAAKSKGLTFNCKLPKTDVTAIIDEKLFAGVMNNLINNALKFTTEGYVEIALKVYESGYKIIVTDSGVGIPKDSLDLIFDEFRQASEGLGRKFQGTGLGLTITKRYIELMGGKISVESEEGQGAEFTVEMPLNKKETMEVNTNVNNIDSEDVGIDYHENTDARRLLVVEDDCITRKVIEQYLRNDYEVTLVEDAEKALDLFDQKKFDVILMDINLGKGMSGIELAGMLKSKMNGNKIPIIASTAFAMMGDKEKFLSAGCDYYISKPFAKTKLLDLLNEIFLVKET